MISSYFKHLTISDLIENIEAYYLINKNDDIYKQIKKDDINHFY